MPGAGEFSVFGDNLGGGATPLVTRKGVSPHTFKAGKVITGGSNPIGAATASQPVADQFFASKLGLFQKCIGIQWGGKRLLFAGGGGNYTALPICLTGFAGSGGGPLFVNAGVATKQISKNAPEVFTSAGGAEIVQQSLGLGTSIIDNTSSVGTRGGAMGYVGIRGTIKGEEIFVMGGRSLVATELADDGTVISVDVAVIFFSTDGGANWTEGSCPTLPVTDGVNKIIDSDPPITIFSTTSGCVTALAFDQATETFYCTVTYLSDNNGWSCAFGTSSDGQNFGGGFSGVSPINVTPSVFPLPDWPAGSRVNDANIPYFTEVTGTVRTRDDVEYASVNAAGQTMPIGGGNGGTLGASGVPGSYVFTGISAPALGGDGFAISGCADGSIVAVTGSSNVGNVRNFISVDGGGSFAAFASELTTTDPNSSVGNVSFS